MNAESFADYLAQPAKLYQLPYQEIKNLVAEYPFSANLHYLLLLKAKIEQDPKFERYLHQYAAHSPDRPFLYELIQEKLPELLDLEIEQEEKLELLDLGTFQEKEVIFLDRQEEETTSPTFREVEPTPPLSATATANDTDNIDADDINTDEPAGILADDSAPISPEEAAAAPAQDIAIVPTENTQESSLREPEAATPSAAEFSTAPLPKTAFDCWPSERPRPANRERFARLRGQNLRARTSGTAAQVRKVAKESVAPQTDLASETLAILLERQGQYVRAIEMYERLSLLNPEKSRYFAAAIEKLKQKA